MLLYRTKLAHQEYGVGSNDESVLVQLKDEDSQSLVELNAVEVEHLIKLLQEHNKKFDT